MDSSFPFLWLCGPSGVGKTSTAWAIFDQLGRAGAPVAYVDADQLGLCYPVAADDPFNHALKARNLGAVWASSRAAGARSLILSGCIDSPDVIELYTGQVPGAELTLCRLRAEHDTLADRFVRRGWMPHLVNEVLAEADALDRADFADVRVDTDGLSVADVARSVRDRTGGWPVERAAAPDPDPPAAPAATVRGEPVPVLLLCGAPSVGKSAVGYDVFTRIGATTKAAYVDLAQIGFCAPAPVDDPDNHRVKAANLAAMWPVFRDAGARCLVVTGRVRDAAAVRCYTEAMPEATFTVYRLHAGRESLADRVGRRARGEGPSLAGDEIRAGDTLLDEAVDRAVRVAQDLHRAQLGDVCVDTDGRSARDVADLVLAGYSPVLAGLATPDTRPS